jgi:hypothetical protein
LNCEFSKLRSRVLGVAVAIFGVSGGWAATGQDAASYTVADAPARLAAGVQAADAAISALQRQLAGRLLEELRQGGPVRALSVCREEAPALTAQTARTQGVRIGRTSHRLRNPGNVAPTWTEPFVAGAAGRKAASVQPVVVDLGDRVGVLRPIATLGVCLQCHGPATRLAPEVRESLAAAYPEDRAVGFTEGDLRGFAWAEAPLDTAGAASGTGR